MISARGASCHIPSPGCFDSSSNEHIPPSASVVPRLPSKRNCRGRARHGSRLPFQLAQAKFVRLDPPVLLPELQSGTAESVQRPATSQSSALVSVSTSSTSRRTRILCRALSAPKGRKARGRTRVQGQRRELTTPDPAENHHKVTRTVVNHPDAAAPEVTKTISFRQRKMAPTVFNTSQSPSRRATTGGEDHVLAEVLVGASVHKTR